jgi:hypothetical protein
MIATMLGLASMLCPHGRAQQISKKVAVPSSFARLPPIEAGAMGPMGAGRFETVAPERLG